MISNVKSLWKVSQRQDLRSLAALRILMATYLAYDIISRLQNGKYSLLWYTSPGFLDPDDTPHRAPLHRIWFYRGSERFQILSFVVAFLLVISYGVGYKCNIYSKTLLWLSITSMQCRCMPPHDGSDTYVRHLILWSIILPVEQMWSLDSCFKGTSKRDCHRLIMKDIAGVWGIRLQFVFMYLGTVMARTIDLYGWNIFKSPWLPPKLNAVHFALNSSFATRDSWLGNMVRTQLPLSQFMTFSAMIGEGIMPLLCIFIHEKYLYIPVTVLFLLHLGLFTLMNLPNWQFVGMLATTIWIPSHVWDKWQRYLANQFPRYCNPPKVTVSIMEMQKKDDSKIHDEFAFKRDIKGRKVKSFITYFLLIYMVYDFMGTRKWIQQLDSGDIGEALRFSQFWQMYNGPPKESKQLMVTGALDVAENVNVWEWIRTKQVVQVNMTSFEENIWTNFTHVYPNPRVERAVSDLLQSDKRLTYFLKSLCNMKGNRFQSITATIQTLKILPPNSERIRFQRRIPDRSIHVKCQHTT
jgi:hypothetical protein